MNLLNIVFGYFYYRALKFGDTSISLPTRIFGVIVVLCLASIGVLVNAFFNQFLFLFTLIYILSGPIIILWFYIYYNRKIKDIYFKEKVIRMGLENRVAVIIITIALAIFPLLISTLIYEYNHE